MLSPRAIVISDLHLNAKSREETSGALERLLARHPDAELILNGDVFELSSFPASDPVEDVLQGILARHPVFVAALCAHLERGSRVTFVAGNHDAALTQLSDALARAIRHGERAATVVPWFLRRGNVHIEHGHVYDPDNAPLHPLADFQWELEPLGAALMRRFIVRSGAVDFAHAHDTTPVQGILRAFRLYGSRAPVMIASYFREAFGLCWEASHGRAAARERAFSVGQARIAQQADEQALSSERVRALWSVLPPPTHAHFWPLFRRLYFDTVFAGLAGSTALVRVALGATPASVLALAATAGYLWLESPRGRYPGRPVRELSTAAREVARITGATRVVFGHTHVEQDDGPYVNTGSFTYPRGERRYGVVLDDSRAEVATLSG